MTNENLESEFLQYASIVKLTEGQEMTGVETAALIASIKNGLDLFKNIADAKDEAKYTELIRVISKMNGELAKLENELAVRQRELTVKDDEITLLKKQLAEPKEKLVLRKIGNYWYSDEDTENPVCKACYDSQGKPITLSDAPSMIRQAFRHNYICPICKTTS